MNELKIYRDGAQWCALLGENIQDGVCGFGDTPEEALLEFHKSVARGTRVHELSPRSRCCICEYSRANFNEKENDQLREGEGDLSNALKALRIANKRIDELEKYNLDLANESHNKSSRIEQLQQRITELEAPSANRPPPPKAPPPPPSPPIVRGKLVKPKERQPKLKRQMRIIKIIYFMLVITPLVLLLCAALWPLERELAKELVSDAFGGGDER